MTPYSLDATLFEALSAFGTVGLSTGITAALPDEAKWVLIACMYVGRLGPIYAPRGPRGPFPGADDPAPAGTPDRRLTSVSARRHRTHRALDCARPALGPP